VPGQEADVSASASSAGPMVVDLLVDSPSPSPTLDPSHPSVSESVSMQVPATAHALVMNTWNGAAPPGALASTSEQRRPPRASGRRKP
jgi:hypothetical protein